MTATLNLNQPTTETLKKITVPCPHCGAMDGEDLDTGLSLHLASGTVSCRSCSETVTAEDLRRLADDVARLQRLLEALA